MIPVVRFVGQRGCSATCLCGRADNGHDTYLGGDANPYTVYDFTETRERAGPQKFLKDFEGYLQADACVGNDGIFLNSNFVDFVAQVLLIPLRPLFTRLTLHAFSLNEKATKRTCQYAVRPTFYAFTSIGSNQIFRPNPEPSPFLATRASRTMSRSPSFNPRRGIYESQWAVGY